MDEVDSQNEKYSEQRISMLDGITIDSSDKSENANDSIRVNREFESKENDESDFQYGKLDENAFQHDTDQD
jgi:hypothetical protein